MEAIFYLLLGLFIFICAVLMLLVLIQKGRGGGLASAFGGAGGNTAFGSKTGDVLTWATSIVFGLFLVLAIFLNLVANQLHAKADRIGVVQPPAQPASTTPNTPPAGLPVEGEPGATTPAPPPAAEPSTQPGN